MKKHELEYESDSRNVRELYAPGKFIITQLRKAEEVLIISVLKEFLGRNPDINDFKKTQRVYSCNQHDSYVLFYDHLRLGNVKIFFYSNLFVDMNIERIRIKFTPCLYE